MYGEAVGMSEDERLEEDAGEEDASGGLGGLPNVDDGDGRMGGGEIWRDRRGVGRCRLHGSFEVLIGSGRRGLIESFSCACLHVEDGMSRIGGGGEEDGLVAAGDEVREPSTGDGVLADVRERRDSVDGLAVAWTSP